MSMLNWCHCEGRVKSIEPESLPDGRTRYKIVLWERNWKKPKEGTFDPNDDGGLAGTIEITAFGTEHYDPWRVIEAKDECAIDGEVATDPADGEGVGPHFIGRFVREAWLLEVKQITEEDGEEKLAPITDAQATRLRREFALGTKEKLSGRQKEQADRLAPPVPDGDAS